MLTDDPKKLAAALEELEAERQRRIDAKVERNEAVRVRLNVVVGEPESAVAADGRAWERKLAEMKEAGDMRKPYRDEGDLIIITGVPRAGRDAGVKYVMAPSCTEARESRRARTPAAAEAVVGAAQPRSPLRACRD